VKFPGILKGRRGWWGSGVNLPVTGGKGVWGQSPQPPEAGGLETKLPVAGSLGTNPQPPAPPPEQFLRFFNKITHFYAYFGQIHVLKQ